MVSYLTVMQIILLIARYFPINPAYECSGKARILINIGISYHLIDGTLFVYPYVYKGDKCKGGDLNDVG